MSQRWRLPDPISDEVKRRFPELNRHVLQLLWNRGHKTQEEMDIFLGPDWSRDTHNPFLFRQMKQAVDRIFNALNQGEVITIHGDYDADGTCGTTVLFTTIRDICRARGFDESKITTYIPHREKEGYGVSKKTMEHLADHDNTRLVITVDCGISNTIAIDRGAELGIDTIVCDHHTMPEVLPTNAILLHPLVPGETFPNKYLCGTGVAFKLACALIQEAQRLGARFVEGYEKWLLDLVAIATVTDVMPLVGENRVLEKYGLLVLNKTRRKGIQKLLQVSGAQQGSLDTFAIGFQIGPRINAAGRMTHANEALELLIEEDDLRATHLAMRLHELNMERQKASQAMYLEAKQQLRDAGDASLLVVVKEGWSVGLAGLVAGKLLEDFHTPVLVVSKNGDTYMGSGRSIEGFDITQLLHGVKEYWDKFGGHPQACGFTLSGEERFSEAVKAMKAYADRHLQPELLEPKITIDAEIALDDITWELFDAIQPFRPFGMKNPVPTFLTRRARVMMCSAVGKDGGHLRLRLQSQTGTLVPAIGFRFGDWVNKIQLGSLIDLVYEIQANEWNGNRELQMRIIDLRPSL